MPRTPVAGIAPSSVAAASWLDEARGGEGDDDESVPGNPPVAPAAPGVARNLDGAAFTHS